MSADLIPRKAWQEWVSELRRAATADAVRPVIARLRAHRAAITAEAESIRSSKGVVEAWESSREELLSGRVALSAVFGALVLEEFARCLEQDSRVALFQPDTRIPREEVVAEVVSASRQSGCDTPFRRFLLLARRLRATATTLAVRSASQKARADNRLALVLDELERYDETSHELSSPWYVRLGVEEAMRIGLSVEVLNGIRFYEMLPRLFAFFPEVSLTPAAVYASMASNSFMPERARQSASVVRAMNRVQAGCSPACYSVNRGVVEASPHGSLMPYFADLAEFHAGHHTHVGMDVRQFALFSRSQHGPQRWEAWPRYPTSSVIDPKSGLVMAFVQVPRAHGCPMTANNGISVLDRLLADAGNHPELLGYAVDHARRLSLGCPPYLHREVLPFKARPSLGPTVASARPGFARAYGR